MSQTGHLRHSLEGHSALLLDLRDGEAFVLRLIRDGDSPLPTPDVLDLDHDSVLSPSEVESILAVGEGSDLVHGGLLLVELPW